MGRSSLDVNGSWIRPLKEGARGWGFLLGLFLIKNCTLSRSSYFGELRGQSFLSVKCWKPSKYPYNKSKLKLDPLRVFNVNEILTRCLQSTKQLSVWPTDWLRQAVFSLSGRWICSLLHFKTRNLVITTQERKTADRERQLEQVVNKEDLVSFQLLNIYRWDYTCIDCNHS